MENNLHPALLRRLFTYIEDFAIENKCHFFITTHSNVVIDQFSYSEHAQIIHVTHDGQRARSTTIDSFAGRGAVLDDIGAKASDILQANGIVWLEGPSDRTYFNKWVELYSDRKLREHRDYECAFYGGSILTHFEAADPAEQCGSVNILRVNRNAVLIGDSDKTGPTKKLKRRLSRIKTEMAKMDAHVWVTAAKEIENYIPGAVLEKVFGKKALPEIGQYEWFYHENEKSDECGYWQKHGIGKPFNKVGLAGKVVEHLTKENLDDRFDLKAQMVEICAKIESWNKSKP